MKILFVMPMFAPGGAEKSLLMLLHALDEFKDLEVDLLLFKKKGLFLKQIPAGVNLIEPENTLRICYSKFSVNNMKSISGVIASIGRPIATAISSLIARNDNHKTQIRWKYAYKRIIKPLSKQYDVACGYLDGESIYYIIDKVCAVKKIGWNQNDYNGLGFSSRIDQEYYKKLNAIVTLTDECYGILKKEFPFCAKKITKIPPIVTKGYIEKCASEYFPSEFKEYSGFKLISVGRLVAQKGFDIAIDASVIMKKRGVDFRWYIIGNGELFEELSRMIRDKGLSEIVFLLGENGNPYPYIKEADVFVQPSRFEGKSVILNEAKLLCKPIIATNYPTVVDQIDNNVNGIVVDMGADSLAKGITSLLENTELQRRLIENLRTVDYNDNSTKKKYMKLFGLVKD